MLTSRGCAENGSS